MSIEEEPRQSTEVTGETEQRGGIGGASEPIESEVTRTPFEAAMDKVREIAGKRLLYAKYLGDYSLTIDRGMFPGEKDVTGFTLRRTETDYLDGDSKVVETWKLDERSRRYHYKEYAEATYYGYRQFKSEEAIAEDARRMLDALTAQPHS